MATCPSKLWKDIEDFLSHLPISHDQDESETCRYPCQRCIANDLLLKMRGIDIDMDKQRISRNPVCPECAGKLVEYADCSGMECDKCHIFYPDEEIQKLETNP